MVDTDNTINQDLIIDISLIEKTVRDIAQSLRLKESYIKFSENKDKSISITLDSLLMFKYKCTGKQHFIAVSDKAFDFTKNQNNFQIEIKPSSPNLVYIIISDNTNIFEFKKLIGDVFQYTFKNYPSAIFGCCSRYVECSDAKQCIHPDVLYAQGCMYKFNLENNRIFYGKNKNYPNSNS